MKKIKFNALNRSNFWEKLPDARHTQASRAGVLIARGPLCDQNSSTYIIHKYIGDFFSKKFCI